MPEAPGQYQASRDSNVWLMAIAGVAAAIPAVLLLVAAGFIFVAGQRVGQGVMLSALFVGVAAVLGLLAFGCLFTAGRRVRTLRYLAEAGVVVQGNVEQTKILRTRRGHMEGVVVWFNYEFGGETYEGKRRTNLAGVAARARDLKQVDLVVDPLSPSSVAFLANGRLG